MLIGSITDGILTGIFLLVIVDQGIMAVKEYSTLLKSLELESLHQMQFSVILRTIFWWESILLLFRRYSQHILSPNPE